jgi:serine/threonine-protein kinase RsbW
MTTHAAGDQGSEVVFRVSGDLDFRAVDSLRAALREALGPVQEVLVIDLSAVDFIDSSGLSVLYEAARDAGRRGLRVRLRGLDHHHHRLLHTVGLADRFDLEPPVERNGAGSVHPADTTFGQFHRYPGEPASVPLIRNYVGAIAHELGFCEAGVRDILIAVSEAATNALKHGSPGTEQDQIAVRCRAEADRLVIEVRDQGRGFDPLAVPVPVAEQLREGGMGIFFMRTLMDEVSFDCSSGGTTVRLVKCRTE